MTMSITNENAIDLFETLEDREGHAETLIASRLELGKWYLRIEGKFMARLDPEPHLLHCKAP